MIAAMPSVVIGKMAVQDLLISVMYILQAKILLLTELRALPRVLLQARRVVPSGVQPYLKMANMPYMCRTKVTERRVPTMWSIPFIIAVARAVLL